MKRIPHSWPCFSASLPAAFLALSLALLLVIISFSAFWTPLYAQSDASEAEPNDRPTIASNLNLDEAVEGTIFPANDVDWYHFDAPNGGELRFTLVGTDPDFPLWVRVWDSDLGVLKTWVATDEGEPISDFVDLPAAGLYFLEIAGDNGASSAEPYTLRVEFTPIVDPGEPNNRFGEATWIGDMETLQANLLPAGDSDWYVLDVDDAGELSLDITDVAEDMSLYVRVWDIDKVALVSWIGPDAVGESTEVVIDLPASGAYYLEIAADTGQRSAEPYTLEWAFTPTGDVHEPNDRLSIATPLSLDEPYSATIFPLRDTDFYAIEAPNQGELSIEIAEIPEGLDINMRLRDRNLDVIQDWGTPSQPGADNQATFDLPAPGHYILEVADWYGDARSTDSYLLTATFTATVDAAEPNNRFSEATPTALGKRVRASILPQGDQDWYSVELAESGVLTATVANVPVALDIWLRLVNADNQVIVDWKAPPATGDTTSLVAEIAEPGPYFLQVSDGYEDARSVEPYSLWFEYITANGDRTLVEDEPLVEEETITGGGTSGVAATDEAATDEAATEAETEEEAEDVESEPEGENVFVAAAETPATISIDVPEGWVREDGDEILVRLEDDEAPGAPTVRIALAASLEFEPEALLAAEDGALAILEEPQSVEIGDLTAVTIGVQEEVDGVTVNRRYLLLSAPDGSSWQIVLQAVSDSWEEFLPEMEALLESIAFGTP